MTSTKAPLASAAPQRTSKWIQQRARGGWSTAQSPRALGATSASTTTVSSPTAPTSAARPPRRRRRTGGASARCARGEAAQGLGRRPPRPFPSRLDRALLHGSRSRLTRHARLRRMGLGRRPLRVSSPKPARGGQAARDSAPPSIGRRFVAELQARIPDLSLAVHTCFKALGAASPRSGAFGVRLIRSQGLTSLFPREDVACLQGPIGAHRDATV
mmetsp:Transcript_13223/g.35064  ORF Transcript_13223/g.35064 Transcript_13223/m.35064 type:complete len:215 (+) Transcript_13223:826-1470(+)